MRRVVITSSPEFFELVLDLQTRFRKKGRCISQARATKMIANAFKQKGVQIDDTFIWL